MPLLTPLLTIRLFFIKDTQKKLNPQLPYIFLKDVQNKYKYLFDLPVPHQKN